MSAASASPKAVVEQYLEAYDERDMETIRSVLADEIVSEDTTFTRDELAGAIEAYWSAFPDCTLEAHHYAVDGETVAVRTTFAGTFEGEYYGRVPTGESFSVTELIMFRVNDGEIDTYWFAWDELGFWEQVGVLEHPLG